MVPYPTILIEEKELSSSTAHHVNIPHSMIREQTENGQQNIERTS
jgi:hypothetical protein